MSIYGHFDLALWAIGESKLNYTFFDKNVKKKSNKTFFVKKLNFGRFGSRFLMILSYRSQAWQHFCKSIAILHFAQ
jgi:hypothetical protein